MLLEPEELFFETFETCLELLQFDPRTDLNLASSKRDANFEANYDEYLCSSYVFVVIVEG